MIVMATACAPRTATYVDPQFRKAGLGDVKAPAKKYSTVVSVEFLRDGNRRDEVDGTLKAAVEKAMVASGVMLPSLQKGDIAIKVVVNNITNSTSSFWKSFGTGLTLGLVGSTVTDAYVATITMTYAKGEIIKKEYKHALHTTVGAKSAPVENSQPTTPAAGFDKVMEDIMLNFISEMQAQQMLTMNDYMHELFMSTYSRLFDSNTSFAKQS
jgi:hypothetical protein